MEACGFRIVGTRHAVRWWFLAVALAFAVSSLPAQSREPYVETFDKGPGGLDRQPERSPAVWDGVAYCFGPWFVDPNHAPPGAGTCIC